MEAIMYGAIAGIASMAGIGLVMIWQEWTLRNSRFVNSLAAGAILGVAFVGLIPEALSMMDNDALLCVLAGFVVFYLLETSIVIHSGSELHYDHDGHHHTSNKAWTVFAGLFLHSLIDGLVIGVGFEVSHDVGILAAMSVVLHELPEGATTFAMLLNRISKKTTLWLSIAVALATPLGALTGLLVLPGMPKEILGALLGFAAGSFVYVGASDLVPETHTKNGLINAFFFVAGIVIVGMFTGFLHGH